VVLKLILEAALLAAARPLSLGELEDLWPEAERPAREDLQAALDALAEDCRARALELRRVASGYRLQVREEFSPWVSRLFEERPGRYSRAFLETLAIIAYRQPVTRGEIEDIRGVAVNTNIVRSLQERGWVNTVGYKEVPGRPALLATTRLFLDHFNLTSLAELPPLQELLDSLAIDPETPQFQSHETAPSESENPATEAAPEIRPEPQDDAGRDT
jgi:segregation and condensation protein B